MHLGYSIELNYIAPESDQLLKFFYNKKAFSEFFYKLINSDKEVLI